MANTYIFIAEKMLIDEEYKRVISREDAEYFDGLEVSFDDRGNGMCNHPDGKSYLYPIKYKHCVAQMSLF